MKKLMMFAFVSLAACGGKLPETRFYQLATLTPAPAVADSTGLVLAIQPFEAAQAYDDERIVYRQTPYRLDYYNYHRWSTSPGTLVSDFLERSFESSGRFRGVTREAPSAPVTLSGRLIALEEVDKTKSQWVGRVVIELTLTETASGDVLWTEQFEELEPLATQNPDGLVQALSRAMNRIAQRALPVVSNLAVQVAGKDAKDGKATPSRAARLKP